MNHGIGYQFKIINDRIKARADADLKTHDLTLTQTRVLGFLAESGGQATQKEIEADLQVSHPTVVGIISRMEQKGFLCTWTDRSKFGAGIMALFFWSKCSVLHKKLIFCSKE